MNRKDKYKDMEKHKKACYRQRRRYYEKTSVAENYMKKWTPEECQMVLDHSITDSELAARLGRSVMSIQGKRNRMKKQQGFQN